MLDEQKELALWFSSKKKRPVKNGRRAARKESEHTSSTAIVSTKQEVRGWSSNGAIAEEPSEDA